MQNRKEKPLYIKLSEAILDRYKNLDYYSPLPGERELCELFHTSRPTIRKAIGVLEKEGKIIRLQGKGTFFVGDESHVDHQMNSIIGFYNDVKLQGKITNSKVLLQNVEQASKSLAEKLEINEGDLIFHLERLRYIDGELYCLTNSYHPMAYCPDLRKLDFSERSLYNTLGEYGIYLSKMKQTLEVKAANAYEAMQLELEEGDSISVWSSVTYDTQDRIVEYVQVKTQAYKTKYEIMVYSDKPYNGNE